MLSPLSHSILAKLASLRALIWAVNQKRFFFMQEGDYQKINNTWLEEELRLSSKCFMLSIRSKDLGAED